MSFKKITLSRSKVISPSRLNLMRDHVKELINEAIQGPNQDLNHGAILIAKLIAICIENLKKQGFYYIQGDQIGYLYDESLKELSVVKEGENDGNKDDGPTKVGRKRPRRSKKADVVIEQPSDKSNHNVEFVYPFLQADLEDALSECSLSDDFNYFDDGLFDFPFGKDERATFATAVDDHVSK